jgi:hypothetical protein
MKKLKTAIVGIQFGSDLESSWEQLKKLDFLNGIDLHFVHISKDDSFNLGQDLNIPLYSLGDAKVLIEHAVHLKLEALIPKILPAHYKGHFFSKCLFSHRPKIAFNDYANEIGANLIILSGDKKHLFSTGSFIQYQLMHSCTHLIILRPPVIDEEI